MDTKRAERVPRTRSPTATLTAPPWTDECASTSASVTAASMAAASSGGTLSLRPASQPVHVSKPRYITYSQNTGFGKRVPPFEWSLRTQLKCPIPARNSLRGQSWVVSGARRRAERRSRGCKIEHGPAPTTMKYGVLQGLSPPSHATTDEAYLTLKRTRARGGFQLVCAASYGPNFVLRAGGARSVACVAWRPRRSDATHDVRAPAPSQSGLVSLTCTHAAITALARFATVGWYAVKAAAAVDLVVRGLPA